MISNFETSEMKNIAEETGKGREKKVIYAKTKVHDETFLGDGLTLVPKKFGGSDVIRPSPIQFCCKGSGFVV